MAAQAVWEQLQRTCNTEQEYWKFLEDMDRVTAYLENFLPHYLTKRKAFKLLASSDIMGAILFRFSPVGRDDWGVTCEQWIGNPAKLVS